MRSRTRPSVIFAILASLTAIAPAAVPSTAHLDAIARAEGNRKDVAVAIGERIFARQWPAQVFKVEANSVGSYLVGGLRLSGVHFHDQLTRDRFDEEIGDLVSETFAAAPGLEEVDVWASVPLATEKGAVVAGDMAMPTWRTVFTVSVKRDESAQALALRLRDQKEIFIDEDWMRSAFKKGL